MANRLTLYFTSDTHGYLYPTNFVNPEPIAMGLLGMAFPKDGNTLVIDGGDTLQGSPLSYYCHTNHIPLPMARVMNDLGYDYITLGNHDFNYGYETLLAHLQALRAKCLCANVQDRLGEAPIASFTVHTLENGLRVGLIGAVTHWINLWEKPENLTHLAVTNPLPAIRQAVAQLKDQVDILIGLYHGGFEKDLTTGQLLSGTDENIACRLCEEFPFDILLTGHQHIAMVNQVYHGTHVVQTPSNATAFVKIEIADNGMISSQLLHPDVPAHLQPWLTLLQRDLNAWLDRPIGRLSKPLWPEDKLTMALHGSAIANFINAVQLDASGAQISCTALGNELRGFDSAVTVRDVVASYTYSNTLVSLLVTGRILRAALEQCATYFAVTQSGEVAIAASFMLPKAAHYN